MSHLAASRTAALSRAPEPPPGYGNDYAIVPVVSECCVYTEIPDKTFSCPWLVQLCGIMLIIVGTTSRSFPAGGSVMIGLIAGGSVMIGIGIMIRLFLIFGCIAAKDMCCACELTDDNDYGGAGGGGAGGGGDGGGGDGGGG